MANYIKITLMEFKRFLKEGKYAQPTGAKRAVGRMLTWTEEEKTEARVLVEEHFASEKGEEVPKLRAFASDTQAKKALRMIRELQAAGFEANALAEYGITKAVLGNMLNPSNPSKKVRCLISTLDNVERAWKELVRITPRRQKARTRRNAVRRERIKAVPVETAPTPELVATPGPRADVWREIISAARDTKVCSFMEDFAPLLKKHNGASERSIKLLHFAEQEGVPLQFVVEAMSS